MPVTKTTVNLWNFVVAVMILITCILLTMRHHQTKAPTAQRAYAMADAKRYCQATAAQDWKSQLLRHFAERRCMERILHHALM